MKLREKQKGFLLNPYRFSDPVLPFTLGTTNLVSGLDEFAINVGSPFREYSAGSKTKVNDGILLSTSDNSTIAIHGGSSNPADNQGGYSFNIAGTVEFNFGAGQNKKIGRAIISCSPTSLPNNYGFNLQYYRYSSSSWEEISSTRYNDGSGIIVLDVAYTETSAVSNLWRIFSITSFSDLTHEIRVGEVEMYEWIPT